MDPRSEQGSCWKVPAANCECLVMLEVGSLISALTFCAKAVVCERRNADHQNARTREHKESFVVPGGEDCTAFSSAQSR